MSVILDLLGDPIPENHGERGRPAHIPTEKNRNKVMMLLAWGWANGRIAGALDITVPTLRKHYFSELGQRRKARDRFDAALGTRLLELAADGSVPAIKELRRLTDQQDLMVADLSARAKATSANRRRSAEGAPLGKKAQARIDAQNPDASSPMGDLMAQRAGSTIQ